MTRLKQMRAIVLIMAVICHLNQVDATITKKVKSTAKPTD